MKKIFLRPLFLMFATILLLSTVTGALAAGRQKIYGHHTAQMAQAPDLGEVESGRRFHIAVSMPWRAQEDLNQFLKELYDPHSPNYRRFLTPAEFTARYGPSTDDVKAVSDYMTGHGLKVTYIHSNNSIVDVEGDNDGIEKAFHVRLHNFKRADGSVFYGPNDDPSVDLDTPIASLGGITNFIKPQPGASKPVKESAGGIAPSGGISPIDVRNSYAPDVTGKGQGQNIALFELSTYDTGDPAFYQNAAVTYGPSEAAMYSSFGTITNTYLDGWNSTTSPGDNGEVVLDIDCAHAMAPMANINVYMGDTADDVLNQIATDNTCKQISASWEYGTAGLAFAQFAAQGQTYFNASGDWYAYDNANNNVNPNSYSGYSLNFADVVIVGGTILSTDGNNPPNYSGEVAWNQSGAASGGGVLTYEAIPSYQQNMSWTANGGSTTNRNAPDIAANAQNNYIYEAGNWEFWWGTSAATPMWAGYMALVNQQAVALGQQTLGFLNPALYAVAQNPTNYATDFHDITSGNNDGYNAVAGFDLVTGWGSPTGQHLINDLLGVSNATATSTPVITTSVTATKTNTQTATLTAVFTATFTPTQGQTGNCVGLPTWTSTGMPLYQAGTLVVYQGNEYKALVTTYGLDAYTPGSTPTVWQLIGPCGTSNTATNTSTAVNTATNTETVTSTVTSTVTNSPTVSSTRTNTPTLTISFTPSNTSTAPFTATNTATVVLTSTNTALNTSTSTNTVVTTSTYTSTPVNTATFSSTLTRTNTWTPSFTPSNTATVVFTATNTATARLTATNTATISATPTTGGACAGLPTWTSVGMPLYQAGTLVVYEGNEYKALVTTYGLDVYAPGSTPTVWQLIGACGSGAPASSVLKSAVAGNNLSTNHQPVKFMIELNSSARVQVQIFTPLGQLVANTTFYGNSGMNNWQWDLKSLSKQVVASGLYVYAIQVTDFTGKTETKTGKIVILH